VSTKASVMESGPEVMLDWPRGDVSRVPYQVYTDRSLYDREQSLIFRGPFWHFLGLEVEIPKADDYKATFIGETPVVVTRNDAGEVHGWVNRCAHRGSLVCRDHKGNQKSHLCVYHQWSYDTRAIWQACRSAGVLAAGAATRKTLSRRITVSGNCASRLTTD